MTRKKHDAEPVTAAGGVVYRKGKSGGEVLLIRRNGLWDLPKGKLEGTESIEDCAVREVEEETGMEGLSIRSFLCDTYHEYVRDGITYGKTTHWYLMAADKQRADLTPQVEEGITKVEWVDPGEAYNRVHFSNLKQVLSKVIEKK
jgi:8-oxo-dGTP pyrophosphatase MutT (NUDIX family)